MKTVLDFYKGLTFRRDVDWVTRHSSRAYGAGNMTGFAAVCFLPILIILAIGYTAGALLH